MTPWSVRPSAGWSKAAARAARASTLHAPSRSEYSEWTCRWAQAGVLTAWAILGARPDGSAVLSRSFRRDRSGGRGDALDAVEPAVQELGGGDVAEQHDPLARRGRDPRQLRDERGPADEERRGGGRLRPAGRRDDGGAVGDGEVHGGRARAADLVDDREAMPRCPR